MPRTPSPTVAMKRSPQRNRAHHLRYQDWTDRHLPRSRLVRIRVRQPRVSARSPPVAEQPANPDSIRKPDDGNEKSSADQLPRPFRAGLKEAGQAAQPEGAAGKTKPANTNPG